MAVQGSYDLVWHPPSPENRGPGPTEQSPHLTNTPPRKGPASSGPARGWEGQKRLGVAWAGVS